MIRRLFTFFAFRVSFFNFVIYSRIYRILYALRRPCGGLARLRRATRTRRVALRATAAGPLINALLSSSTTRYNSKHRYKRGWVRERLDGKIVAALRHVTLFL